LRDVTQATPIARVIYAAPAWRGFLNVAEKDCIESVINKAKRYGYLPSDFENVHTLVKSMESKLFIKRTFAIIWDNDLFTCSSLRRQQFDQEEFSA